MMHHNKSVTCFRVQKYFRKFIVTIEFVCHLHRNQNLQVSFTRTWSSFNLVFSQQMVVSARIMPHTPCLLESAGIGCKCNGRWEQNQDFCQCTDLKWYSSKAVVCALEKGKANISPQPDHAEIASFEGTPV